MHLKEYLESRRFTYEELVKAMGPRKNGKLVSPNTISHYCNGERMPNLEIGYMIQKFTKIVKIEDLINYYYEINK